MLRVALTGGIASGKSAASARFAQHGIPVVDADIVSRELVEPGQPALHAISEQFGAHLLNADGTLNRARLREQVFASAEQREALQVLLHPLIHDRMLERSHAADGPYLVLVIPLLAESTQHYPHDRVLLIDCPEALQRQRLATRDGSTNEQIEQILSAQSTRKARLAIADDVIINDREIEQLHQAVDERHQFYLRLSQS